MDSHKIKFYLLAFLISIFSLLCLGAEATLIVLLLTDSHKDNQTTSTYLAFITTIIGFYSGFIKSLPKTKKSDPLYLTPSNSPSPPPSPIHHNQQDFV